MARSRCCSDPRPHGCRNAGRTARSARPAGTGSTAPGRGPSAAARPGSADRATRPGGAADWLASRWYVRSDRLDLVADEGPDQLQQLGRPRGRREVHAGDLTQTGKSVGTRMRASFRACAGKAEEGAVAEPRRLTTTPSSVRHGRRAARVARGLGRLSTRRPPSPRSTSCGRPASSPAPGRRSGRPGCGTPRRGRTSWRARTSIVTIGHLATVVLGRHDPHRLAVGGQLGDLPAGGAYIRRLSRMLPIGTYSPLPVM